MSYYYDNNYEEECLNPNLYLDPHPFDDITLIEPYLNQKKYWCDKNRNYIEIEEMGSSHALNALRLLIRKEEDLLLPLALASPPSPCAIIQYPLAQALVTRIKTAKEIKYPWEKVTAKKRK